MRILQTCRELGIKIVAYSPLGRGFLSGAYRTREQLPNDYRAHGTPKLSAENLPKNVLLLDGLQPMATKYSITLSQLALAWLHAQVLHQTKSHVVLMKHGMASCTGTTPKERVTNELLALAWLHAQVLHQTNESLMNYWHWHGFIHRYYTKLMSH